MNGTGSYMTKIFFDVLEKKHFSCSLRPDTMLPGIHIDDTVEASLRLIKADRKDLKRSVYNLAGVSVTPEIMIANVRKIMPFDFTVSYDIDEVRQRIADSWTDSIDDKETREEVFKDWLYIDDPMKLAQHIYSQIFEIELIYTKSKWKVTWQKSKWLRPLQNTTIFWAKEWASKTRIRKSIFYTKT
jgi:hypothetical protein